MSKEKNTENKRIQTEEQSAIGNKQLTNEQQTATNDQQSETSNVKPQTNMETHAHHLHKAPGKKWSHYLFEFLMLFLAVFCGFLAENFREHQVEKERARQYIHSLYLDFRFDTSRIAAVIDTETAKIASLSKMSDCYETIKKNWKDN